MGAVETVSGLALACTKFVQEPQAKPKLTAMAAKPSDLRRMKLLLNTAAKSKNTRIDHSYPQNPRVNPEIRRR
jgi:hypothetical protein